MRKNKFIAALIASIMVTTMSAGVVMAETQTEKPTFNGKIVTCTLKCDFNLFSNDTATAVTMWGGMSGCRVKTMLFSCPNAFESYKLIDAASNPLSAYVSGSKSGVWKFKSQHYVTNSSGSSSRNVCVLTDW